MSRFLSHLNKYRTLYAVLGLVILGGLYFADSAFAQASSTPPPRDEFTQKLYQVLSNIVLAIVQAVGNLTALMTHVLLVVSSYNEFINVPVVRTGWALIRDITNMFFIIALLIIAAGTILRIENYRYNRLLARVVIMAFLVNYSRLIAGFLIQTSQVVMLTFVNSYKDALFGNFASMFGLDTVLQFAATGQNTLQDKSLDFLVIFMSLLVGLALMIAALIVTIAMVVVLTVRIVALWILVILSPIAYALRILPNTEKYASQWWANFGKYLVTGPVLAFFLWLALTLVVSTGANTLNNIADKAGDYKSELVGVGKTIDEPFVNQILSLEHLVSFMIAIIFLTMALKFATDSGTAGAKLAGRIGTGVGLGVSGANWLRDRTIAPLAGWSRTRQQRNQRKIAERADTMVATSDRLTSHVGLTPGAREEARAEVRRYEQRRTQRQAEKKGLDLMTDAQLQDQLLGNGSRRTKLAVADILGQRGAINLQDPRIAAAMAPILRDGRVAPELQRKLRDQVEQQNVRNMTVDQLRTMANDANETTARNGIIELERRKQLSPENAADVALTRRMHNMLGQTPQKLADFNDSLMKSNPRMAIRTLYNDFNNGTEDINRLVEDINQGKISDKHLNRRDFAQMRVALRNEGLDSTQAKSYYANRTMEASRTAEELKSRIENLQPEARSAAFGGVTLDPANQTNRDKQHVVAEGGFIDEAYQANDLLKGRFVQDEAGRVAQLAREGRLSRQSLRNDSVMQEMMDSRRIGRTVINEMTKNNPEVRGDAQETALRVVQNMNAAQGATANNSSTRGRQENGRREIAADLFEGGQYEYTNAAGVRSERSVFDIAYQGLDPAEADNLRRARQNAMTKNAENYTRMDTSRMTDESVRDVTLFVSPSAIYKIADKNPELAKEIADRKRTAAARPVGSNLHGAPIDSEEHDKMVRHTLSMRRNDRGI